MIIFRKSTLNDIDQIVKIADDAKALLKRKSVSQWQRGTYPDRAVFENDVKNGIGYVLAADAEIYEHSDSGIDSCCSCDSDNNNDNNIDPSLEIPADNTTNEILAICAVTLTDEADYRNLTSGKWLTDNDDKYATIHRSAVALNHQGKNLSGFLFSEVASMAKKESAVSIRIDTHPDNITMQKTLENSGFVKCGEFYISEGDEAGDLRYAYELLISK